MISTICSSACRVVLVLGSEGKGLRQRTRDCCDAIGRLDMPGDIKSLNVSNAAAISLYAVTKAVARHVHRLRRVRPKLLLFKE